MTQGVTASNDRVFLNFESGSFQFDEDAKPPGPARNIIRGLHTADLGSLTNLPGGTLRLGSLHAKEQDDLLGPDTVRIGVEGEQLGRPIGIKTGQRKKIDTTVQFTGNARITLVERDYPDPDDRLGTRIVTPGSKKESSTSQAATPTTG